MEGEAAMGFIRLINGLADRLCVVAGAFAGSQIPQFMQQYMQRLAGHVEELQRVIDHLNQLAAHSNKTLNQYIYKFLSNSDPDFSRQGEFMQQMLIRWEQLSQALQSIVNSSMWARPYVLLTHLDYDIAHSTLHSFQPGLSLTIEGFYYTGIGLISGFLLYQGLSKLIQIIYTISISGLKRLFS